MGGGDPLGESGSGRYADPVSATIHRDAETLVRAVDAARRSGARVVFTNGCFDLLHAGHVRYLTAARRLGDVLVVGINDDASVRRLKGPPRPILSAVERAEVVAGLAAVDHVVLFAEDTPLALIRAVRPDVLVKGADWAESEIVGRAEVEARGGRVVRVPLVAGRSTSALVACIRRP